MSPVTFKNILLIFMSLLSVALELQAVLTSPVHHVSAAAWEQSRCVQMLTTYPVNAGGIMPATHLRIRVVTKYASRLLCLQSKSADLRG